MDRPSDHDTRRALCAALGLLLLGVGLGAVLRVGQLTPLGLHVGNATHAHSHTLYWGWAGLGLFALFFERIGLTGRWVKLVLGALALQALATFFVFLRFGYGTPGVVLSAATLVPFLAAVVLFLSGARGMRGGDLPFLRAAVVYVVLGYVSALSRVVLKVRGVDDPFLAALAVHLFLGTFGAFFVLGVMGLTVRALGGAPGRLLGVGLGVGAPLLAWPSVLTVPGVEGTTLGTFVRLAAVVMLVPGAAWSAWVWQHSAGRADRWLWRSAAAAWTLGVLLFALVASGALKELVLLRHAVVLVVHLQTLGVVSASLLLLLELKRRQPAFTALWLHQGALAVMLVGLGVAALWPGTSGLALAAAGGVGVVAAQSWSAARFWLGGARLRTTSGLKEAS